MSYSLRVMLTKPAPLFAFRQLRVETAKAWRKLTNIDDEPRLYLSRDGIGIDQNFVFNLGGNEVLRSSMNDPLSMEFTIVYGPEMWTDENRISLVDLKLNQKSEVSAHALTLAVALPGL
jgi:hypothetical protein